MFRNYKSRQFTYNPTILEAVRVSWATLGLFTSVRIGIPPRDEELISAVNGYNNPVLEAAQEAREVFGKDRPISTILSLGSGNRGPLSVNSKGFLEKSLQGTEAAEESIERLLGASGIYFRLSPDYIIQNERPISQLGSITAHTLAYLEREKVSRSIDDFLLASECTSSVNMELKGDGELLPCIESG